MERSAKEYLADLHVCELTTVQRGDYSCPHSHCSGEHKLIMPTVALENHTSVAISGSVFRFNSAVLVVHIVQ